MWTTSRLYFLGLIEREKLAYVLILFDVLGLKLILDLVCV